ncbi:ROK family protein [Pseudopelagicola sp. nBUS_19]|uniref:ROK family transcriptional regulator n=1 Tax=Pseudopelagicola sp. nBUS_19 TaxID=3395316 RepID=UPI003EBB9A55
MIHDPISFGMTDHQRAILGAVLAQPHIRRAEVSDRLGISVQTTMRAVLPLIDSGVLTEIHAASGNRGKPARELGFVSASLATIGISLAVDRVRVEVCDLAGQVLSSSNQATNYDCATVQLSDLDRLLDTALAELPAKTKIIGAGVSVQGYLMSGSTRFAAKADPAGWAQIDLMTHLRQRLGVLVQLMNDGRTLASSLIRCSPHQDFICLHIGSGIGGGVVSKGMLVSGANGNAGEIGALFPAGPERPVEPAFLTAAGLDSWSNWAGLPQGETPTLLAFLDQSAGAISDAIATALALLDFEAIYVCSRMPLDLLSAITDRLKVDPIGATRFDGALAATNAVPLIYAHHVPNHAQLACRMALDAFLAAADTPASKG